MKRRFLIHSVPHMYLVVDITSVALTKELHPRDGEEEQVPLFQFRNWRHAEHYFAALGVEPDELERSSAQVKETGVAVLTIV
jgi:hypothetical protein